MTNPTPLRAGDRGWLVDLEPTQVPRTVAAITAQPWASLVEELIPAAQSILVVARTAADASVVGDHIRTLPLTQFDSIHAAAARTVVIPVRYDGPDLESVARQLNLSTREVVTAHASARHRVGFFGFAPGFAYIEGVPEQLAVPRLSTPRTRVPAGIVAIAGRHTCVYPGGTPGGWQLIGTTTEVLWDTGATPPNRLDVGDHVLFEAVP